MSQFLKRTLPIFLAVCLLFCVLPTFATGTDAPFREDLSMGSTPAVEIAPDALSLPPSEAQQPFDTFPGSAADTTLPTSNLVVTSYQVLNSNGAAISRITTGTTVTLVLTLKNSGITTNQAVLNNEGIPNSANLDVSRLLDSFTGGVPSVELLSVGELPLEVKVTFSGLTYSGSGREFRFMMGYRKIAIPYDSPSVTIRECEEYTAPSPPTFPSSPEPMFLISRADNTREVTAGGISTIALEIRNVGSTATTSGIVSLTPSAGLMLMDNTFSYAVDSLSPGQSIFLYVKVKAAEEVDTAAQSLSLQFSYNYYSAGASTQGSTTIQVPVRVEVRPTVQNTEPILQIGREGTLVPVTAGQEFYVTVWVRNLGGTPAETPVITVTPSSELILMDHSTSQVLPRLAPGGYGSISVKLKAIDTITSPTQELGVDIQYHYINGKTSTQASASNKIVIPAKPSAAESEKLEPVFQFGQEGVLNPVAAGQEFTVTVWVKNLGETAARSPVLSFAPSDGLMLLENSTSKVLGDIPSNGIGTAQVKLKALNELSSPIQELNLELKYRYDNGKTSAQGTASGKLVIPARPKTTSGGGTPMAAATPSIIIQQYSYGGTQVAAGDNFTLSITIVNTSQTKTVENVTMSMETDEGLSITSSSNTFFFQSLGPGATISQSLDVRTINSEKVVSPSISISFKYEYIDQNARQTVNSSEKISIPVYQPIRFEVTPPNVPTDATVGTELTLTLPYVNKGKGTIYNVAATLDGTISALTPTQNLGNFEPGKSGSIDFILTPQEEGSVELTLHISYENASAEQFSMDFPVKLAVNAPLDPSGDSEFDPYEPEPGTEESAFPILPVGIGVGCAAILVLVIMMVLKKRHAKPVAAGLDDDAFADDSPEEADENK